MGRVLWFVLGLAVGIVLVGRAGGGPAGRRMLGVGSPTGEFLQTVADSYRARQAETTGAG